MKKAIIAALAAATVMTGVTAVSTSGHHMGIKHHNTAVCTTENCPNKDRPVYGCIESHKNSGKHHTNCGVRNTEYCPYR